MHLGGNSFRHREMSRGFCQYPALKLGPGNSFPVDFYLFSSYLVQGTWKYSSNSATYQPWLSEPGMTNLGTPDVHRIRFPSAPAFMADENCSLPSLF